MSMALIALDNTVFSNAVRTDSSDPTLLDKLTRSEQVTHPIRRYSMIHNIPSADLAHCSQSTAVNQSALIDALAEQTLSRVA